MALTKDKKNAVVAEVGELLSTSKMTVVARYEGTTVKAMQELRHLARDNGTQIKVAKNRLVKKALEQNPTLKGADASSLAGMLLYAFSSEDEVSPAKSLANFAKANPTIQFVGAITAEGKFLSAEEVTALASLPSKAELIASVIATLAAPLNDSLNALSGNLQALLDGLAVKAS